MLVLKTLIYIYNILPVNVNLETCTVPHFMKFNFIKIFIYYLFITYILGVYWNMFTGNYSGSRMRVLYRNLLFILYFSK